MSGQTLAEFLLARIAGDKERASDLHDSDACNTFLNSEGWCTCDAEARVLADCEAKRQLLEAYREEHARRDAYQADDARAVEDEEQATRRRSAAARCRGLEIAVELLALPYNDHPAYREEFKP